MSIDEFRAMMGTKPVGSSTISAKDYRKQLMKKHCRYKAHIESVLNRLKIPFMPEHKFLEDRKFRFDFIILPESKKVAIEYEGIFSDKSRHTNVVGYSKDSTKYNLAQSHGWTVLRYTAMNIKEFENDIKKLI